MTGAVAGAMQTNLSDASRAKPSMEAGGVTTPPTDAEGKVRNASKLDADAVGSGQGPSCMSSWLAQKL